MLIPIHPICCNTKNYTSCHVQSIRFTCLAIHRGYFLKADQFTGLYIGYGILWLIEEL